MRLNDRMTEDADWREGINAFRLDVRNQIEQIMLEINKLKQQLKEASQ